MNSLLDLLQLAAFIVFIHMSAYYLLSMIKKDASIVDIVWGIGIALIGWVVMPFDETMTITQTIVLSLVTLWALRLASHIYMRKNGQPEDWRYQNWRKEWGPTHWWRSYLQVFLLQGALQVIVALPLLVAAAHKGDSAFSAVQLIGLFVWGLGFFFESVGDYQLSKFITEKKQTSKAANQIMQSGLWKYTRHPNYFGEITQWWGLFIIVAGLENGLIAIISPLLITFLLLKVSGITMLEKKYEDNGAYQDYKARTSALIPLPPKSS